MRGKSEVRAGVTLVELIVASAVSLTVGTAILAAFLSGQRSFVMGTNFLEIHGDARVAMDNLVRDIKWASQLQATHTIGGVTYTAGPTVLILSVPAIDANKNIITGVSDTIIYQRSGTDLLRIVDPDGISTRTLPVGGTVSSTVSNNVSALVFTSNADRIGISLTVQKTVLGGRVLAETLASTISLRNRP